MESFPLFLITVSLGFMSQVIAAPLDTAVFIAASRREPGPPTIFVCKHENWGRPCLIYTLDKTQNDTIHSWADPIKPGPWSKYDCSSAISSADEITIFTATPVTSTGISVVPANSTPTPTSTKADDVPITEPMQFISDLPAAVGAMEHLSPISRADKRSQDHLQDNSWQIGSWGPSPGVHTEWYDATGFGSGECEWPGIKKVPEYWMSDGESLGWGTEVNDDPGRGIRGVRKFRVWWNE